MHRGEGLRALLVSMVTPYNSRPVKLHSRTYIHSDRVQGHLIQRISLTSKNHFKLLIPKAQIYLCQKVAFKNLLL